MPTSEPGRRRGEGRRMPYSNNGGPWGGGGGSGGGDDKKGGGRGPWGSGGGGSKGGPGGQPPVPDIDEIVRKGQEQLKILMGGRGGRGARPRPGGGGRLRPARAIVCRRGAARRRLAADVVLHGAARGAVGRAHLRRVPRRLHRQARASTSRPGRSSPTRSSRSRARTPRRSARAPCAAPAPA